MAKVKFGDVVKEVKNKIDRNNNPYEFYVAGDHMDTDSLSIPRRGSFLTDDVGPAFIREFKKGQVLYGSRRTYLRKVAVADFDGVTANTTFVLETKDENLLRQRLLPFIMYTEGFTAWSIKKSRGSTNPYVLFKDLADYEFDLPSIEEQDKLAEVLWSINDTLQAYQKLLAETDALVQAQFVSLFCNNQCPMEKLNTVADITSGLTKNSRRATMSIKLPYLRVANVLFNELDLRDIQEIGVDEKEVEKALLQKNDLLIVEGNGSPEQIGRVSLWDGSISPMLHQNHIIKARFNTKIVIPDFAMYYYMTHEGRQQILESAATTSGLYTLSLSKISGFTIPVPPIKEQLQFVEFAHQSERSKSTLQNTITSLQATKRSILERALGTGRKE